MSGEAIARATLASGLPVELSYFIGTIQNLRAMMLNSPLTDARRFAADLETAYRRAWHDWCALAD